MTKLEQLTKELQALIEKPDLNEIIERKMRDAFYEGQNEESTRWVARLNKISERLKDHMPEEEKERMNKTHFFYAGDDDNPECNFCGVSEHEMDIWPQYCLTKKEKEEGK